MSDPYVSAQEWKARLLRGERAAAGELLRAYGLAVRRIEARVRELTDQITAARRKGEIISSPWLFERDRLTRLKMEIQAEMQRFSQVASLRVAAEQRTARELGTESAQALVGEATGAPAGVRLGAFNRGASAAIAGFAADGSPLRQLFAEKGVAVASGVGDELVAGVTTGASARVIAGRIRLRLGGEMARALTVARTETIRAYREATHETYVEHSDVLRGWYWSTDFSGRTCAMCIAMHGKVFPVGTRMHSHVNCRCVQVPLTLDAPDPETGAHWFKQQEPGLQKSVLGPGKYEAFKTGKFELDDLVGVRSSERWGTSRFEKPLSTILS